MADEKEARPCGPRKRQRVSTTESNHDDPIAPNLVARAFDVNGVGINRVWVADMTPIMNLDHVRAFRSDARGNLEAELLDGTRVPVSRARAQELRSVGR